MKSVDSLLRAIHFATSQTPSFCYLTIILLTWRIWWAPNNASKWQMGFNSAFKGLNNHTKLIFPSTTSYSKWSLCFGLPTKILHASLLSPMRATCLAHLIPLHLVTFVMFVEEWKSRNSAGWNFHQPADLKTPLFIPTSVSALQGMLIT